MSQVDLKSVRQHFAFGKNWLNYANLIDEARIKQAADDLMRLGATAEFKNSSFLDIGCGSGLHAVAAARLGAQKILCVDIDENSVAATRQTIKRFANESNAMAQVMSVFDLDPEKHGTFDIVYSWGVLHHTGDMQLAISKAMSMVAPGGFILIALYRKTPFCGIWRRIKRTYSRAPESRQQVMLRTYLRIKHATVLLRNLLGPLLGRAPFDLKTYIAEYPRNRGMDYYTDVHDWLGGYPYESIAPSQCRKIFSSRGFQCVLENSNKVGIFGGVFGSGCDEYCFIKSK